MRARTVASPTRVARKVKPPAPFDGPADHSGARRLLDGQALAGEHRLVDRGRALHDLAVHGDPLAGPDPHEIADAHVAYGQVDLGAAPEHARRARRQRARAAG